MYSEKKTQQMLASLTLDLIFHKPKKNRNFHFLLILFTPWTIYKCDNICHLRW